MSRAGNPTVHPRRLTAMDTHRTLPYPSRHRPARVAILLAVAALAIVGCGSGEDQVAAGGQETTTSSAEATSTTTAVTESPPTTGATTASAPPTTAGASCPVDDWQAIDAGDFSFRLPPGVEDQQVQGIDSLVGQYDGAGMSVGFDYGGFTNDFGDVAETGAAEELTVDGYAARIITSDVADTAGYGSPYLTAIYVSVPEGPGPSGRALGLSVTFEEEALAPVAHCIVRSVAFR